MMPEASAVKHRYSHAYSWNLARPVTHPEDSFHLVSANLATAATALQITDFNSLLRRRR